MARRRGTRANNRGNHTVSVSTPDRYRLLITWPHGAQSVFGTSDKARARSVARNNSTSGATVEFQVLAGWSVYRTTHTYRPDTPR